MVLANSIKQGFYLFTYLYLFSFYFIIFAFTYMCIHCLCPLPLPLPPTPASRQNRFCSLALRFCWRENIRDNKKDIVLLLLWDKDSYTERSLALLLYTCILQPTLVHLCQTSSLLPRPLPIVASASLRLLYSLHYSGHISHIQVLGFRPFPYSSCAHSPLSVWPMFNNITAFILGL
jgi:hypothetical protein